MMDRKRRDGKVDWRCMCALNGVLMNGMVFPRIGGVCEVIDCLGRRVREEAM